jgi:predicted permease
VARTVHSRPSAVLMPPSSPRRRRRRAKKARYAGIAVLAVAAVVAGAFFAVGLGRGHAKPPQYASASASVPLLGSSVGFLGLPQTTSEFGQLPVVRVYYPGLPASNAWAGRPG